MNIKPISYKILESKTKNIYEAVVVVSKRASQVLHDRLVERMMRDNTEEEIEYWTKYLQWILLYIQINHLALL